MNRGDLGVIMRYTTGHAHLLRHNKIAGTLDPPLVRYPLPQYSLVDPDDNHSGPEDIDIRCRLCDLKGKEERVEQERTCTWSWGFYSMDKSFRKALHQVFAIRGSTHC